jgi:hypothetical protein
MNNWRQRATHSGCHLMWFVEEDQGYSACLCLDSGRLHLFHDGGRLIVDSTDDCGYLCIADLPAIIESLVCLKEQIDAARSAAA